MVSIDPCAHDDGHDRAAYWNLEGRSAEALNEFNARPTIALPLCRSLRAISAYSARPMLMGLAMIAPTLEPH